MMSSKKVSLMSISFKQYSYKLRAHTGLLNRLLLTQILALLLSLLGTSSMGAGSGQLSVTVRSYSANIGYSVFYSMGHDCCSVANHKAL